MKSMIGTSLPRPDAVAKVTGAARYPADLIQPSMLHLQIVFARRPHARILSIDTRTALCQPGVVAVLTAEDVPSNAFGLIEEDQPVLCRDVVRFEGDKVALVVAETKAAALVGAQHVHIEYKDLPIISCPRAALAARAPLVHEERGSNLLFHMPLRRGDCVQGFCEAEVILEENFTTSWQEHAYLQPEAGIAYLDEEGRVVIETAGQWLHEDRRQIARILQIPEEQVILRYATIGGAFGGREDLSIQPLLALATWKLRRSTSLVWSREESILGHHKRHPISIHCRWGARKDGRITAVEAEILADGGAYASTSPEVLKVATLFATGCYEVPNISVDGYVVYTNNIPAGAFRGFGAPQAQFASEVMMTRLAHALEIDPIEMRRRNIYREGSIEPTQHPLPPGVSALPVLERCAVEAHQRLDYGKEHPDKEPHLRRGLGIACGLKNLGYSFGYPEQSTATVELLREAGKKCAIVRTGAADVGQGAHLLLRQIAAEVLTLPLEHVTLLADTSDETPNAGSASASRLTLMAGRAVRDAALAALHKLRVTAADAVQATVQYRPPATTSLNPETGSGIPNYCYGYAAQAIEVEVNILTGQVKVLRVVSVHDVGRALNPQQVEGQIEGGLAQALGYALLEHFQVRNGHVLTPNLSTYLLPTALDMPVEITPIVLEYADVNGPFGSRGVAELPLVPFLPALVSAIHDAVGVWITQQPVTPEVMLQALRSNADASISGKYPKR